MAGSDSPSDPAASSNEPVLPARAQDDSTLLRHPLAVDGPPSKLSTDPLAALSDPDLLPSTDHASTARRLRSHLFLLMIVATGVLGSRYLGLDMLQGEGWPAAATNAGVAALGVGGVLMTGGLAVDWYEIVLGWWWVSAPIMVMAGLVIVMAEERTQGVEEVT